MGIMGTLREPRDMNKNAGSESGSVNAGTKGSQPPSFYEAEMTKWKGKFTKAVDDRAAFKKRYLSTDRKSILTTNDNFTGDDADTKLNASATFRGPGLHPTKSEFKRVTEARKTRNSNGGFCVLDVEMTGNTA